jgi:catechol 2,3-dioxygenase-like lactoylglutathione lyase family enzyme
MLNTFAVTAVLPFKGLAAARDFYEKKLGLRLAQGSVDDGFLRFEAGRGTFLDVLESDSKKSEDTAANFEVEDLAKEMKDLRAKGVRFEEYDLPDVKTVDGVATMDGMKAAWVKDPGGNVIGLTQKP